MKIGLLPKLSGCSAQAIRYSKREGLLSSSARSEGDFRLWWWLWEGSICFVIGQIAPFASIWVTGRRPDFNR